MANHAASLQLPIMVRKPRMVWPGLDKEGLHLKSIAGDGKLYLHPRMQCSKWLTNFLRELPLCIPFGPTLRESKSSWRDPSHHHRAHASVSTPLRRLCSRQRCCTETCNTCNNRNHSKTNGRRRVSGLSRRHVTFRHVRRSA